MLKSVSLRLFVRAFFVFIFVSLTCLSVLPQPVYAADWYNSSWDYRKEIVIDQTDDLGADAAYQIKLLVGKTSSATGENVDLNGHCQDDFDDLRFTKSDGTTLLDYWIESVSGSGDALLATVWVEAVLLDDAADTTIYMYYGNAAAAAASNGANTFVFFDDFSGTLSDLFNTWGTAANSSGICQITGADSGIKSKSTFAIPCRARALSKTLSNDNYSMPLQMRLAADETDMSRILRSSGYSTTKWSFDNFNEGTETGSASTATIDTSYHIFEIQRIASNNHKMFFDNAEVDSETNATYVPNEDLTVGARANGQSIYVDWMLVTKFTTNEPTWSSFGSEEASAAEPTVTTQAASLVEETTATGNGNITDLNDGGNCTVRGFEYDTDSGAPYANSAYDNGDFSTGAYTKAITGLTQGELYYMRAYATNPVGTGYGSEVTFLTKPNEPTGFTATPGDGKVDLSWTNGTGSDKVMIRYRTDGSYPTGVTDGTQAYFDTGTSYEHSGLSNGTTYKYRGWSYVTEGALEQYSDAYIEASATPGGIATVTTNDASLIEETTATTGGNITNLNGAGNCTRRGVEYDIDSGAPYANSSYEDGDFGTGSYSRNLTSLTKGELYYFRAYAVNTNGTGYGSEKTFLTKSDEPNSLTAVAAGENDINLTWNKGTGAQKTIIRGKEDSYPANIADGSEIYNDTGTSTTHSGLGAGEHWYYRAWSYVTEGALEQYSDTYDEDNAITQTPPQVITGSVTGQNKTWLVANAEITNLGADDITVRGFDYGLTDAYGSSVTTTDLSGYSLGNYSATITGLTSSTVYHYRAKVYNGVWGYGADRITATTGSPVIEYYFQTASDNTTDIYGVNWAAQTFTTDNATARTVTSIRLLLNRVGNPGTVTVSLRDTSAGKPTGIDIASGTIDGGSLSVSATWYKIDLTEEKSLAIGTQYVICVNAINGDESNYVEWSRVDAGGFDNGSGVTSVNGGLAWTVQTYDFNFEIWSNSSMVIEDAKVFTGYKETGDWLIAIRYINTTAPYYDTYDSKRYFALQFILDDDTLAQTALPTWGNSISNIYLSANQVSALTYGDDFIVRMYGNFSGNPYTDFALTSANWMGSDLSGLDSWVITSASVIGDYYDDLLTTYISGRGEVLNATGGAVFTAGINGLSTVRPELFQVYTLPINYTGETTDQTFRQSVAAYETTWGADGALMLQRIENWLGVDGGYIGGMIFVIMMLALAILAFPAGHTTAANILSIPCLGLAVFFGLDLVWLIMLALFAAFLLFKNMFMDK